VAIQKQYQIKKISNFLRKIYQDNSIEISKVIVFVTESFTAHERRTFERQHPTGDVVLMHP